MTRTLIRGATLVDGTRGDLLLDDGRIAETGSVTDASGATVIDADGLLALPGLVDLHTHLREPGFEQSETVLTGSRAAAAGGYTAVFPMANTSPVADTAGVVEQEFRLGEDAGYVTVQPIGAVTVGLAGSGSPSSARWQPRERRCACSPTTACASGTRCSCDARSSTSRPSTASSRSTRRSRA
ncbi:hypothetical protein GCM10025877_00100 [Agromyces mangrovi Wang et al. 2018]|nr:hypothetical protein GCM10025877_00100 [Agromyces mangrovi]